MGGLNGAKYYLGKVKSHAVQVSGHLTQVAWVGCVSLAGVPCNLSRQLLACVCLLQLSHLLSTKLTLKPFLPTLTLLSLRSMGGVNIGW